MQAACTPDNAGYNPEKQSEGVDRLETRVLAKIAKLRGCFVVEEPNSSIQEFKGSLLLEAPRETDKSLGTPQLLLQGNTALVACMVVYCGGDNWMIRNLPPAPAKISN